MCEEVYPQTDESVKVRWVNIIPDKANCVGLAPNINHSGIHKLDCSYRNPFMLVRSLIEANGLSDVIPYSTERVYYLLSHPGLCKS